MQGANAVEQSAGLLFRIRVAGTSLALLLASSALGQFYVDSQRGDDAYPGTTSRPFRTIQRGVDAAANRPGHDEVFVMPRRPPYRGGIRIEDHSGGLALRGHGHVLIEGGVTGIEVASCDPVELEHLVVSAATNGIEAYVSDVKLKDVHCVGNSGHGLLLILASATVIDGSFSDNGDDGIHAGFFGNPPIELMRVECAGNSGDGTEVFGSYVRATNCQLVDNGGCGLRILECVVDLDHLSLTDNGIGLRAFANGNLTRSTITRNRGHGLELVDVGTIRVSRCTIADNLGDGIHVEYDHSVLVTGSLMWNNRGNGIQYDRRLLHPRISLRLSLVAFNSDAGILGWASNPPDLDRVGLFRNGIGDLVLR